MRFEMAVEGDAKQGEHEDEGTRDEGGGGGRATVLASSGY